MNHAEKINKEEGSCLYRVSDRQRSVYSARDSRVGEYNLTAFQTNKLSTAYNNIYLTNKNYVLHKKKIPLGVLKNTYISDK